MLTCTSTKNMSQADEWLICFMLKALKIQRYRVKIPKRITLNVESAGILLSKLDAYTLVLYPYFDLREAATYGDGLSFTNFSYQYYSPLWLCVAFSQNHHDISSFFLSASFSPPFSLYYSWEPVWYSFQLFILCMVWSWLV